MLQRRAEKWSRSNEEGGGTWGMREKGPSGNSPASAETERQREYSEQRLRTQRQIY